MASLAAPGRQRSPTSVASAAEADNDFDEPRGDEMDDGAPRPEGAKQVTPPPAKKPAKKKSTANPSKRDVPDEMKVEKRVIDEILLVMGSIGSTADSTDIDPATGQPRFTPVPDAVEWLNDFQRVLKRDDDTYRQVGIKIGKWQIVAQKLLPLVLTCRYDKAVVLTVCKILVILTKPMAEAAKNAGRMSIDVKSGKHDADFIEHQEMLQENAIAQSDLLMEYKRLFVRHPSHAYAFKHGTRSKAGGQSKSGTGLLSVFINIIAEPLAKTGASRTTSDHVQIELVLQLIRHLLCIAPLSTKGSVEESQLASQLHEELMVVLKEEMAFDLLVCLGQDVGRRENAKYNLLLMEILGCVLKGQDPTDVARSTFASAQNLSAPVTLSTGKKSSKAPTKRVIRTTTTSRANATGANSLKAVLQTERSQFQRSAPSRHGHFAGTLMVSDSGGKKKYVSASDYLADISKGGSSGKKSTAGIAAVTRRKNKKAEVFVGSKKSTTLHSRAGASASATREVAGAHSRRSKQAMDWFCKRFFEDCYGPVMKSLKNEFRRESGRLEDGDRTVLFRIIWFFHQWWRVGMEQRKKESDAAGKESSGKKHKSSEDDEHQGPAKSLVFTMDVYMFNLVLNSTDEFFEHKKPAALAQTTALYTEMMHMLRVMYDSDDDTENSMALGLMDRLFYQTEPLDRVPRLLSRWSPGMFSREFLCDLVECTHVTLKLLDANAERLRKLFPTNDAASKRPENHMEEMNLVALDFDKDHYFQRKFVSNQIVFMYTQLLSQYSVNAADVNRHVAAYFIRLCKFQVKGVDGVDDDVDFDDSLGKNELAPKQSTLEPILYNVPLFTILDRILNDATIRENQDFAALLMFAASFMKRFARAAEVNPMLFVEAMFKHPVPQRFCQLSTNLYVNEELRMMAVRDLLMEDQRRGYEPEEEEAVVDKEEEKKKEDAEQQPPGYDDDEEEEAEFNEDDEESTDGIVIKKKKRRRKSRKSRKSKKIVAMDEDGSDDEEEAKKSDAEEVEKAMSSQEEESEMQDGDAASETEADEDVAEANVDAQDASAASSSPVKDASKSPSLSGKKRIRKSKVAALEDSDDEDFAGPAVPAAKMSKKVIFDDDSDDE